MSEAPVEGELRLDAFAAEAGVPTSTIRLYRQRDLLPAPRLVGRTGWYGPAHLARLRLIADLQDQGFSLAGIGRLLESWDQGRDLTDLVDAEEALDAVLRRPSAVVVDPADLAEVFPSGALTPELVQRAAALGVVQPTDDGRVRVPDRRFLDVGGELTRMGVPLDVVLDEWEALTVQTDAVAARFVGVFEQHLLGDVRLDRLDADEIRRLAGVLDRLRHLAGVVVLAALDASTAEVAAARLGALVDPDLPSS